MIIRWTSLELSLLREMYKEKTPIAEIAENLNKTEAAVRNKAYKLGITNNNSFTQEEIDYIKQNYKSYNLREIANELGRDHHNVCRLAKQLGIKRSCKKKETTKGFIDEAGVYHLKGWKRKTALEIAEKRSIIMKEWHKTHEHPRGMLGKHHTDEYRKELSERLS